MNGQYIEWRQLWDVYEKISTMSSHSHGLNIAPKLTFEHLKLTSYSRMQVDLAAQVCKCLLYASIFGIENLISPPRFFISPFPLSLFPSLTFSLHSPLAHLLSPLMFCNMQVLSKTTADLFAYFGDPSTTETQKFIRMFDKLFDCLNVRSLTQWIKKMKPDLKPSVHKC